MTKKNTGFLRFYMIKKLISQNLFVFSFKSGTAIEWNKGFVNIRPKCEAKQK